MATFFVALLAWSATCAEPVDEYQPQFHPGPAKNWVSGQLDAVSFKIDDTLCTTGHGSNDAMQSGKGLVRRERRGWG